MYISLKNKSLNKKILTIIFGCFWALTTESILFLCWLLNENSMKHHECYCLSAPFNIFISSAGASCSNKNIIIENKFMPK